MQLISESNYSIYPMISNSLWIGIHIFATLCCGYYLRYFQQIKQKKRRKRRRSQFNLKSYLTISKPFVAESSILIMLYFVDIVFLCMYTDQQQDYRWWDVSRQFAIFLFVLVESMSIYDLISIEEYAAELNSIL